MVLWFLSGSLTETENIKGRADVEEVSQTLKIKVIHFIVPYTLHLKADR